MSLLKLNDILIDTNKISYIGKPDTLVKAHIGITIHFFLVVIDGHPVQIETQTKDECLKLRETLVDKVNVFDGCMPG